VVDTFKNAERQEQVSQCSDCAGSGDCVWCNGTGKVDGERCPDCQGSTDCERCDGTGELDAPEVEWP
jgi:hypothetical protein